MNDVVYEAILTQKSGTEAGKEFSYIGLTSQTFKERYQKHKYTLKHKSSKEHTALSELAHKMTERGIDYSVDWRIIEQARSYNGLTCNLCLSEKSHILFNPAPNPLNKRTELLFKCRHMGKYTFSKEPGGARHQSAEIPEIKNTETTTTTTTTQATQDTMQRADHESRSK